MMDIQIVHCRDPGTQRRREILALGWSQQSHHLLHLNVPRTKIIEDGDAEQVGFHLLWRKIFACPSDHKTKLQLVVHLLGVIRPQHLLLMTDEREGIAFVVEGHLVVLGHRLWGYQISFK